MVKKMKKKRERRIKWMMKKVSLCADPSVLVGYMIMELGNDILRILGVIDTEPVRDIGVFFSDAFYL